MKHTATQSKQSASVLVLTSYPDYSKASKKASNFNAVGWHSKRLLTALSEKTSVTVFAEVVGKEKVIRESKNLTVYRVWKKGNILSLLSLYSLIRKQKASSILVQFEFNVFGGILPNLALLAVLALCRLSGKTVVFEEHQVITDIKKLEKHIHITNPLVQKFFNVSLVLFYMLIGLIVNRVIVFEQSLKDRLTDFMPAQKIEVLSLAVEAQKTSPQIPARTKLNKLFKHSRLYRPIQRNEFVVLVFGFINGYKGIDWITKLLGEKNIKNVRLLIAGGENPYLKQDAAYQEFYRSIVEEIEKHASISYTNFVLDEYIPLCFSGSDVVVLPYEVFMSASGPFSHALSHKKPILISKKLADYTKSADIRAAMKTAHVSKDEFVFGLNNSDLPALLQKIKTNPRSYHSLVTFSETLAEARSMESVSQQLYELLVPDAALSANTAPQLALS